MMNTYHQVFVPCSIVLFFICAATHAETITDADLASTQCDGLNGCSKVVAEDPLECSEICGCSGIYKYDHLKEECVLNYEYLRQRTKSNNLMQSDQDLIDDDDLAKKIREHTERVFRGIIYCAIFFIVCAGICVISVCLFCCRIHYSDNKLKKEVKELASKLNVDYKKKRSIKKKSHDQKNESCNVIVEDTHIMCV